jgi:hypothetical protein
LPENGLKDGIGRSPDSLTVPVGAKWPSITVRGFFDELRSEKIGDRVHPASTGPSLMQSDDVVMMQFEASRARRFGAYHSPVGALFASQAESEGFHNSATSLIAADLEDMLRRFVLEDEAGRNSILIGARRYYDEIDTNFPNVRFCLSFSTETDIV